MGFGIAVTNLNWHGYLNEIESGREVNFWTPTPWKVKLAKGTPWAFMLKAPIRKLGGFGLFSSYEEMKVSEAWNRWGEYNGVGSEDKFRSRISEISKRNVQHGSSDDPVIGCVVLTDPVFWSQEQSIAVENLGVQFPSAIVKWKWFEESWPSVEQNSELPATSFELIGNIKPTYTLQSVKYRIAQHKFRQTVIEQYNSTCCITGTSYAKVLEAAHIQPYLCDRSNHPQNALCLRTDVHRLFDAGLLTITKVLEVRVSTKLRSTEYSKLEGKRISLPSNQKHWPSMNALDFHLTKIFKQ